jgi:hypothetical protein
MKYGTKKKLTWFPYFSFSEIVCMIFPRMFFKNALNQQKPHGLTARLKSANTIQVSWMPLYKKRLKAFVLPTTCVRF